jgi:UDP-GlcNAc:undecaprenyl-phosphate GlcNAc-1-phosphate transferase
VAIYAGFVSALLLGMLIAWRLGMHINFVSLWGMLAGGTLLLIIGIIDDIRGLSAITKLIGQIIAAGIAMYFGIQMTFFSSPFSGTYALGIFSIPLTLLWIVGITNTLNLIDGLDGLATGVTAIAALTLFTVALRTHQLGAAVVAIILAGGALGFLRYNFFPASIFLGDSGSLFLGYILAVASVMGVLKSTLVIAFIVPILILGVPIYDTASAIIRRVRAKEHIFKPDKRHLHHRLLKAGFTHREAVIAIYLVCIFLSVGALAITAINAVYALILFLLFVVGAFLWFRRIKASIRKEVSA